MWKEIWNLLKTPKPELEFLAKLLRPGDSAVVVDCLELCPDDYYPLMMGMSDIWADTIPEGIVGKVATEQLNTSDPFMYCIGLLAHEHHLPEAHNVQIH